MRLEEVLPFLREGKVINHQGYEYYTIRNGHVQRFVSYAQQKELVWTSIAELPLDELLDEDWEVVE